MCILPPRLLGLAGPAGQVAGERGQFGAGAGRVRGRTALQQLVHAQPPGAAVLLQCGDRRIPLDVADPNVLVHVTLILAVRPPRRNRPQPGLPRPATAPGG